MILFTRVWVNYGNQNQSKYPYRMYDNLWYEFERNYIIKYVHLRFMMMNYIILHFRVSTKDKGGQTPLHIASKGKAWVLN